jgi:hypothetical protein
MTEALQRKAANATEAAEWIHKATLDYARGGPDLEAESIALATEFGLNVEAVRASWADVKANRAKAEAHPKLVRLSAFARDRKMREARMAALARAEAEEERTIKAKSEPVPLAQAATEKARKIVGFHPSDLAPDAPALPTIEEKNQALEALADLWDTDPLAYADGRKVWADRLCTTVAAIDKAVRLVRDRRVGEGEQSQTTKISAIGVSDDVQLWHSPHGDAYASVRIRDHWENYRLDQLAFEEWLCAEYGRRYQAKVNGEWAPQVPGSGAIRDAIGQLKGIAKFSRAERNPAVRVGGDRKAIWIDLCRPDWKAVRVTAEGWQVEPDPDVAFLRTAKMLPLPKPIHSGDVRLIRRVINIAPTDLVLVSAWLLQTLNPVGPYPIINVCGPSEEGKSTTGKNLRKVVDPNSAGLRRASRKIDDLLIAARNGWVICLDNMSWMTVEWSDNLCMISTGISTGTRKHYTNDEEHVFTVQRPLIFNGISDNLIERGDLASRTIKLQIPRLTARRTDAELDEEFESIWPSVFGALLDGLVGGLRDGPGIRVDKPARLMDFERFAEAGCRAMGFDKWEFVKAYAANRECSMVASAEASAVGRAILAFMKNYLPKHPEGFAGKMETLYDKLENYRGGANWRDWPKDATRLSTELSRLEKPLAAYGINCLRHVDRRTVGGSQKDVILEPIAARAQSQ